jgi:hypothetical protein
VTRPLSVSSPNSCPGLVAARACIHKAGSMGTTAQYTHFVGIDASMDWLDVHVLPDDIRFRVANSSRGVWSLIGKLTSCDEPLVVMEASGGFEGRALDTTAAAGVAVAMVNPRQIRSFARALGVLAKMDQIDALPSLATPRPCGRSRVMLRIWISARSRR